MPRVSHDIPPWSPVAMPAVIAMAQSGKRPHRHPGRLPRPAGAPASAATIASPLPTEATGVAGIGGRVALPITVLVGLLAAPGVHARQDVAQDVASRQQVAMTVEEITAEANARSAAGMPAAEVEAWIQQALSQAGLSVRKPPPESWDVYGMARWNREAAKRAQTAPPSDDTQAQSAPQGDARAFDYDVYRQPEPEIPHAAGPEQGLGDAGITDIGKAPRQGSRPQD